MLSIYRSNFLHGSETYASQITVPSETIKVAATENKTAEVLLDHFVQAIGGGKRQCHPPWSTAAQSIPVNSLLFHGSSAHYIQRCNTGELTSSLT